MWRSGTVDVREDALVFLPAFLQGSVAPLAGRSDRPRLRGADVAGAGDCFVRAMAGTCRPCDASDMAPMGANAFYHRL